jgi:hypothetical protein
MNWYKESKQGSYYETYARQIASWVIDSIKQGSQSNSFRIGFNENYYPIEKSLGNSGLGKFYCTYRVDVNPQINYEGEFEVEPIYGDDGSPETNGESVIRIKISLTEFPPKPDLYSHIYENVMEVVRHELEHFGQNKSNYRKWRKSRQTYYDPKKTNYNDMFGSVQDSYEVSAYKYMTQPTEIGAFVSQLYLISKKKRISFYSLLKDKCNQLKNHFIAKGVDPQKAENISDKIGLKWQLYAEQRYPVAK